MLLHLMAYLDTLADIVDRKIREDDCLEYSVCEVKPHTECSRKNYGTYYVKKFHKYECAEYVTEKSKTQ